MTSWQWILIGVLAGSGVLIVYPYLIYPAILRVLRPDPLVATMDPPGADRFALLFSAYNEIAIIHEKLANLRALRAASPELEVRAYDDCSSDGTGGVLGSAPDVLQTVGGLTRMGKAHGMKTLVETCNREFLVFTDANVTLSDDSIARLGSYFSDPRVGGVCGHLVYESKVGTQTEVAGARYWKLDESIKRLESRSGNVMGGDGSIFAVRKSLYPKYAPTVQDDFTVTMAVVFAGYRLVFAEDVVAFETLVSKSGDEYRRKVRIAARAFHTHRSMVRAVRGMSLQDRWRYASHKVIRWYGGLFLLVAAASAVALGSTFGWAVGLATAVAVVLALVVAPRLSSRTRFVPSVVLAMLATLHGLALALAGRTFPTWSPPPRDS